jgi:hypothetical protein
MDLLQIFQHVFPMFARKKLTPADFRRGTYKDGPHKSDPNSRHIGAFGDKVIPMKRRFRGVSRTAQK